MPVVVVGVFPVLEPNFGAPDGADPNTEPEDAPVEAGAPKVKLDMAAIIRWLFVPGIQDDGGTSGVCEL